MDDNKLNIIEALDVYLPDVDGVINCMHNYCLQLNKKSTLTAIAPRNKRKHVDNLPYRVRRCKSFFVPILNDYYGVPNLDGKFKKDILKTPCDIVHVHSPFNMAKYSLSIAKKRNIPAVATFHTNLRPIYKKIFLSKHFTEFLVKQKGKLYNKFDEVFVCSKMVEDQVRSFGYTGKVTIIPFGTDMKKADNVEELREKANAKFNIDKDELVFIYVGRIMKLKRIDFILDSLKILKDKGLKFKFIAVGKGADLNYLKDYSKKLGFTETEVVFTGFVDREDFPLYYSRGDLLLFPSLYDNFGLVKVEAAAHSTAGVYIKDSCAGYEIIDGVNGFLSDDNVNAFSDTVYNAVKDRDNLKKVGEKAASDLYISWEQCSDLLLDNLKRVINEHKAKTQTEIKQ